MYEQKNKSEKYLKQKDMNQSVEFAGHQPKVMAERKTPFGTLNHTGGIIQRVAESEFNQDPSAFMEKNQVLVNFGNGIIESYDLNKADIDKIAERQKKVQQDIRSKIHLRAQI